MKILCLYIDLLFCETQLKEDFLFHILKKASTSITVLFAIYSTGYPVLYPSRGLASVE